MAHATPHLPNQIEFDPGRPRNTSGGNGDIFHGKLHRERQSDDSPFQYSDVALKRMRCGTADEDNVSGGCIYPLAITLPHTILPALQGHSQGSVRLDGSLSP